ncbi:nSTAND1 domain-containing NTPase [Nocardia sp. NPDC003482]
MSRVFISHSGRDSAWALAVARWLVAEQPDLAGEIFLDIDPETGIRSGQRWKDALRTASQRCEAVVCLVSRNWLESRECEAEYRAAEYFGKRIFCARIERPEGGEDITREWQHCDLFGEGPYVEIDVGPSREPVQVRTAGLQQLLAGLRAAGIGSEHFSWPPLDEPDRAPYRGWVPFAPQDAAVFFGRDGQILRAMDMLRVMRNDGTRPLFVVVGASGTGKSSFLRAGLIPRLRRDDRHFLVLEMMRPGRDALTGTHGLAASLHATRRQLGLHTPDLGVIKTALAHHDTASTRRWLLDIQQAAHQQLVDTGAETATLVLPIDQAEELVSADAGAEGRVLLALLADLLRVPVDQRLPLIVAVTIRTDRYQHLQTHPALTGIDSVLFDDLKPMPRDRFREIITGPVRRSPRHLELAADLVDRLIDDCGEGTDTLPLLSLTLATLYRDYGTGGALTVSHYTRLGGIDTIVATEVAGVLSRDPAVRQEELALLRSAFIPFLVTIAPNGDQPLRRTARWDDLPADARPLIDRFVDRRLLVKDHRTHGGRIETVVEVAVESLLRQWDDLAAWLREEADDLRTAENIERAAEDWHRNARADAWLATGARLIAAEALAGRPGYRERLATTIDYLVAARQHEDARRADILREAIRHATALRTRVRIAIAFATVAVLVAVTAGFYYFRADAAERHATSLANAALAARLLQDAQLRFTAGHRDDRRAVVEALAAHALSPDTAETGLITAQYQTRNVAKITGKLHISALAVSEETRRIVSDDAEVWDLTSDAGPRALLGTKDSHALDATAMSPDGRWLASASSDVGVRVWDLATEAEARVLPDSATRVVRAVAVSTDGRWIVADDSTGDNGSMLVWDLATGVGPRVLPGPGKIGTAASLAISPDGRWIVAAGYSAADESVRIWDLATDAGPRALPDIKHHSVEAAAVSPDGRWVVTAYYGDAVRVWDLATGAAPRALPETAAGNTYSVAVSPNGRWIVGADRAGTVRVWDLTSDASPRVLPDTRSGTARSVAVSPDGRWVMDIDSEGVVRVWDLATNARPRPLPDRKTSPPEALAVSPDGRWIVEAGSISPDGRWIVESETSFQGRSIVRGNGSARVWDMATNAEPRVLHGAGDDWGEIVAVSPDGRWVVSDTNGVVRVWDMATNAEPRVLHGAADHWAGTVAVSPDGRWIVDSDFVYGIVRVWGDLTSNAEPRVLDELRYTQYRLTAVAVSSDGRWLAGVDQEGAVLMWDLTSRNRFRILPGLGSKETTVVAVSPDGHLVATGDDTGGVHIWSTTASQAETASIPSGLDEIGGLAFDTENRSINVASSGRVSRIVSFADLPFAVPNPKSLCAKLATPMTEGEWDAWVTPSLPPARLCDPPASQPHRGN